jgi:uncharacterized protein (DUF2237 family)
VVVDVGAVVADESIESLPAASRGLSSPVQDPRASARSSKQTTDVLDGENARMATVMHGRSAVCCNGGMAKNVLGTDLQSCSSDPVAGFFRDGCCNTGADDAGVHVICAQMTDDFLEFSKAQGNDLSTPMPAHGFAGLTEGDQWCLCAQRWKDAFDAGKAPKIVLEATHAAMLEWATLDELRAFAVAPEPEA